MDFSSQILVNKKKKDTKSEKKANKSIILICGVIIIALLAIMIFYASNSAMHHFTTTIVSLKLYHVLIIVNILCVLLAILDKRVFNIYIITLILFFTWFSVADQMYDPIDETLQFENANHIIDRGSIATYWDTIDHDYLNSANQGRNDIRKELPNYEAVQTPLYYFFLAIFGVFIKSAYLRFHLFRVISLMLVFLTYICLEKCVQFLKRNIKIELDEKVYRAMLLLTIFSPQYLYRASRINNETGLCVLMAVFIYITTRCLTNGYKNKYYWGMAFLCAGMFLTKSTSIYAYVILALVALCQKRIREAVLPTLASGIIIIPWFLFNYRHYGRLTAMKEHLGFVLPIVNPNRQAIDIFDSLFNLLPGSTIGAESVSISTPELVWGSFLYISAISLILYAGRKSLVGIIEQRKTKAIEADTALIGVYCSLMIACLLCLIASTIITKIPALHGRYFYAPSIVLVLLSLILCVRIPVDMRGTIILVLAMAIGILAIRWPIALIDRLFTNERLFACKIESVELCDLTDENWVHGYSRGDNKLLLSCEGIDNIEQLKNRLVTNGNQTVIITDCVKAEPYIWLITNVHMQTEQIDSNKLRLLVYDEAAYNTGVGDAILDNIEGKRLSQSLTIQEDSEIWGFDVNLATYQVDNYLADVEYRIIDENGVVLCNGQAYRINIKDNNYARITFNDCLQAKKGQQLSIELTFDNTEDLPLAAWTSASDQYPEGILMLDGKEIDEEDLGFKLIVARTQ